MTAVYLFFLTPLKMAVLEIQANGDTAVSKEAIAHAGQSLEDPLMRVNNILVILL